MTTSFNKPVQSTAATLCSFCGLGDFLLPGFVLAQSPAAVPDLLRWAEGMKLIAYLVLLLCVGCVSEREIQPAVKPHAAIVTCSGFFYADQHRWPKSREELAEWAADHKYAGFPNERYKVITFEEQKDGSLLVRYECDTGNGTVQIRPAKLNQ